MRDIKKEVKELFDNMSDEEFEHMLNVAGFDVQPGYGEVVFKDINARVKYSVDSVSIKHKINTTFNMKQKSFTIAPKDKTKFNSFPFRFAC